MAPKRTEEKTDEDAVRGGGPRIAHPLAN
jgi:hypothetical protein